MRLYRFLQLPTEEQMRMLPTLKVLKPLAHYTRRRWFKRRTHGVKESLTELTFGEVNLVKRYMMKGTTEGMLEAFKVVYKCSSLDIMRMEVMQFYRCVGFLSNEASRILEMERRHWHTEPTQYDSKLEQAGVKELEQFSDLPMIDSLAGGDILRYNDIEALNYLEVHYILWYRAVQANVQNRFQKLITNR